jgi:hypothetical protein
MAEFAATSAARRDGSQGSARVVVRDLRIKRRRFMTFKSYTTGPEMNRSILKPFCVVFLSRKPPAP